MPSLDIYSGASAVDGYVDNAWNGVSWASLQSSVGFSANDAGTLMYLSLVSTGSGIGLDKNWGYVRLMILLFDAYSVIPTGATVTSATLNFYAHSAPTGDHYASEIVLTNAPVTAYTSLVKGDFELLMGTRIEHGTARIPYASITEGWYSFTLNSTALTTLNSTLGSGNVFELGMANSWVFDNIEPTWVGAYEDVVTVRTHDHGTSSTWPYLTVNYKVLGGNTVLTLTGTKADASDTLDADLWAVEVFTSK